MKILHLTLKKKWFDMILAGIKKEEYRDHSSYWKNRLIKEGYWHSQSCKHYDVIHFTNGYGASRPQIFIECKGISVKDGGNPAWGWDATITARCFVIKLGDIIETRNVKKNKNT